MTLAPDTLIGPQRNFLQNLRDLPGTLTLPAIIAGFLVTFVGYTGPMAIVIQAGQNGGLTPDQIAAWIWAVAVGNGIVTMFLCLRYRQPLCAPYSTAGAALLVTGLTLYSLPEAVGAYIIAALCITVIGLTGLFERAMKLVPRGVVPGVLAGILLPFGMGVYKAIPDSPVMIISMIIAFYVAKRWGSRAATPWALLAGFVAVVVTGQLHLVDFHIQVTQPMFVTPVFRADAVINLALPLVLLALTSQYATGQAVQLSSGYEPPMNEVLTTTGIASVVLAFLGGHGQTLGALTAAIVTSPEAHPDPTKRYGAAFMSGVFYVIFGIFGATISQVFAALPASFVTTAAGLALTAAIMNGLVNALQHPEERDSAIVAFLCTASGAVIGGIAAPFWGLLGGTLIEALMRFGEKKKYEELAPVVPVAQPVTPVAEPRS
jgi:benzoate membrane transport protein